MENPLTAKLRALLKEATPGPWRFEVGENVGEPSYEVYARNQVWSIFDDTQYYPTAPEIQDAALIVEMRNSIEALLDVVEAAKVVYPIDTRAPQLIEALAALEKV